ncbi:glutathione S-transferase family protein [Candidatus Nitrotoga sp. M5]|uniref:glutathione S-transferase family protein n=1 Tax=Candidatus Nitrotoga sp. M5 TaxID=2890409 RepID=UPI001EF600DB|nr:glutathione S-transferase family protein [Candidatus Nitrotoga sp. M5]CAH1387321.1 Glutathione S-transferase [Candidatus Nitrotoga sp. M5]
MYTLYYLPGACSLATQVVLHELDQPVELVDVQHLSNFTDINPVGTVPVLIDGDSTLREGAAILLHLLYKHKNAMLPICGVGREQAIEDILFANATMHPAYSRLFFIAQHITDMHAKQTAFTAAAKAINTLWQVVEQQLAGRDYLGGERASAADIMLAVYSRWGANFPVTITQSSNTSRMLDAVQAMPSFQRSLAAEQTQSAA